MNLYYVEVDPEKFEYDTVTDAVVWAQSAAVAKHLFAKIKDVGVGPYRARQIRLDDGKPKVVHTHMHFS